MSPTHWIGLSRSSLSRNARAKRDEEGRGVDEDGRRAAVVKRSDS